MLACLRPPLAAAALIITQAATAAAPQPPQVALVADLYRAFAFEAVLETPALPGLIDQPRAVLLRYFTPELADLLLRDRACTAQTREICRLDFAPLWGNQDPTGAAVQIQPGASAASVMVQLRYPGASARLTLTLARTASGWRIADIGYGDGQPTLRALLAMTPAQTGPGKPPAAQAPR